MIEPRIGSMEYKDIGELSWDYMFISACLTAIQLEKLKLEWKKQGESEIIPWWKFVMENTKIELDIK